MKKKYKVIPKILFITGLPSSGKTTLALFLKKKLNNLSINKVVYIDGDKFRKQFNLHKYDNASRKEIGDKKIKFANKYLNLNKLVIVTGIGHKKVWRKKIKKKYKNLIEIYTKCPLKICEQRDYKKNYFRAKNKIIKNFIGVNEKYQSGNTVDLILNTYKDNVSKNTNKIVKYLKIKKYVF